MFTSALVLAILVSAPTPLLAQPPAAVPPDYTGMARQKTPTVVAIATRQRAEERSH
jgi:hypothetical protein